jgi:hypothetical protein
MAAPTLYKKREIDDIRNREIHSISNSEKTQTDLIVNKFFELFKIKHLS